MVTQMTPQKKNVNNEAYKAVIACRITSLLCLLRKKNVCICFMYRYSSEITQWAKYVIALSETFQVAYLSSELNFHWSFSQLCLSHQSWTCLEWKTEYMRYNTINQSPVTRICLILNTWKKMKAIHRICQNMWDITRDKAI